MTFREKQLKRNGPMHCKDPDCVAWRKREPEFCKALQRAGVVAHYMGVQKFTFCEDQEIWMLDGITPVTRKILESYVAKAQQ